MHHASAQLSSTCLASTPSASAHLFILHLASPHSLLVLLLLLLFFINALLSSFSVVAPPPAVAASACGASLFSATRQLRMFMAGALNYVACFGLKCRRVSFIFDCCQASF